MEKKYWPFDVLPLEDRTEQHKREIRFFETAEQQGYKGYEMGATLALGAEAPNGREGMILRRGRNRWEVSLGANQKEESSAFYHDFDAAADAVFAWLRG